jgi:hypothetical protein
LRLRYAPALKIKSRRVTVAIAFQEYRQSFQTFAVHPALPVQLRDNSIDNLITIKTR